MGRRLVQQKRSGVQSLLKFVHLKMLTGKKIEKKDAHELEKETKAYLIQYEERMKQLEESAKQLAESKKKLEEERAAFLTKQRLAATEEKEDTTDTDEEYLEFVFEHSSDEEDDEAPPRN